MRTALRIAGGLALVSAFMWAFFGIPLWVSVAGNHGREMVIGMFHIAAIFGGVFSFVE